MTHPLSETENSCARSKSASENANTEYNLRSKRKAAKEGQEIRRLREKFA